MTRIVSYNILTGGYSMREQGARRTSQLTAMIHSTHPDIVGIVEATHPMITKQPLVIEEIAENLGMQLVMGGDAAHLSDYQIALLTRLPIVYSKIHPRPGILNKPVLEVCVEESNGEQLIVFVTHLNAAFYKGWAGNGLREREVREILRIMAPAREQGKPHLLMGDFNSLAPGDPFKASFLVGYVVGLDRSRRQTHILDGNPHLNFVVPPQLRFLKPILRIIPSSALLSTLFDAVATFYAPRGCIKLLLQAKYVDCFRNVHPRAWGFSCPAASPAGRIDYIFADPILADRLETCYEVTEGEGVAGSSASDHLPITADFGLGVEAVPIPAELNSVTIR
jgi:endonuclease/exonuclease/phosphatase family metal-dependent hydrolase